MGKRSGPFSGPSAELCKCAQAIVKFKVYHARGANIPETFIGVHPRLRQPGLVQKPPDPSPSRGPKQTPQTFQNLPPTWCCPLPPHATAEPSEPCSAPQPTTIPLGGLHAARANTSPGPGFVSGSGVTAPYCRARSERAAGIGRF
ncbi:hypothetical protein chiPu_0002608 [Chiloscyllium punctatum]|uniref:Uncharacterized protein n=1 Tax=Chiloscyllium punctatum TaxID=137246 RepID=A0A401S1F8_CHIPU|nr:hypothetical protein [Chiloscyllium punctatum]